MNLYNHFTSQMTIYLYHKTICYDLCQIQRGYCYELLFSLFHFNLIVSYILFLILTYKTHLFSIVFWEDTRSKLLSHPEKKPIIDHFSYPIQNM